MKFYSTRKNTPHVGIKEIVFRGIAQDGGLYMPEFIPMLDNPFFENIENSSLHEIAFQVSKVFLGNYFSDDELNEIISESLNFRIPLTHLHNNIYSLELFHGPTLAFKDVGARFMARICKKLLDKSNKHKKLSILVATSGDTGGAVANGFFDIPNIEVFVLYPKNRVSAIQEKQFTTLGKNIIPIQIDGNFDDCQLLVKTAFADVELREKIFISSANSINFSRLLPQAFYYFYGFAQIKKKIPTFPELIYCVPSGNFGNLTAAIIAQKMGLPINRFIAATNINKVVPDYLETGKFQAQESVLTLSNAMDVGNPSNFERILDIYKSDYQCIKKNIIGNYYTDNEVLDAIKNIYEKFQYILDPHSAIGYLAINNYLKKNRKAIGIFIQTAHPSKFIDTVEKAINKKITIPDRLNKFLNKKSFKYSLRNNYIDFKKFLIQKHLNS